MQALTVSAQSLCSSKCMSAQSMNHKQRCGLQTWDGHAKSVAGKRVAPNTSTAVTLTMMAVTGSTRRSKNMGRACHARPEVGRRHTSGDHNHALTRCWSSTA